MSTRHVTSPLGAAQSEDRSARERLLDALPTRERRCELAGISTAVLEGGDGPPLVLLHGPGAYAAHWLRVIPALVRRHRVVAPDLPGHGGSELGAGPLDRTRVLAWLRELIEQTCSTAPALVGELVGGAIAACFAAAEPSRISRLVLADSFGLSPFQPVPEFAAALQAFGRDPSEHTHRDLWQYCAHDLPRLRQDLGALWDSFERYNVQRAASANTQTAMHQLMAEFAGPIPPADLARITAPVSLIWGRHDLATPLSVAEAASARYGWPLHVIEGANDAPAMERPEAFARVLLDTLKGEPK